MAWLYWGTEAICSQTAQPWVFVSFFYKLQLVKVTFACVLPLVGAEAGVCRGQQRLQVWCEFVQLHSEGGEAIVEQVILWLWICGGEKTVRRPAAIWLQCW